MLQEQAEVYVGVNQFNELAISKNNIFTNNYQKLNLIRRDKENELVSLIIWDKDEILDKLPEGVFNIHISKAYFALFYLKQQIFTDKINEFIDYLFEFNPTTNKIDLIGALLKMSIKKISDDSYFSNRNATDYIFKKLLANFNKDEIIQPHIKITLIDNPSVCNYVSDEECKYNYILPVINSYPYNAYPDTLSMPLKMVKVFSSKIVHPDDYEEAIFFHNQYLSKYSIIHNSDSTEEYFDRNIHRLDFKESEFRNIEEFIDALDMLSLKDPCCNNIEERHFNDNYNNVSLVELIQSGPFGMPCIACTGCLKESYCSNYKEFYSKKG